MFSFFGTALAAIKLNPAKYIMYGIMVIFGLAIIFGVIRSCDQRHNDANNNLINQGATIERSQSQGEILNAVQTAKSVVEHPSAQQLNVVCSKYDRNCPSAGHP